MAKADQGLESRLGAIPFGALIGGPLNAAIEAQAQAAQSTVEFIRSIGFESDDKGSKSDKAGSVRNIKFTYGVGEPQQTLLVPLLTIVPIPFIRIEAMSINFKASMSQSNELQDTTSSSQGKKGEVSAGGSYLFASAKMSASISSKKDSASTRNSKYAVEYTIDVTVNAVQDDMPAGMARVLNLLAESIETEQNKA